MTRNRKFLRPRLECLEDRATPATFNVTTTIDVVDPADGKRSLREAITAANNLAGADVIVVPAAVYKITLGAPGENANSGGDFDVTGTVTIQGAGAEGTVIDGQHLDRVFDIFGTAPSSIKVVFQGLTVRNGSVTGDGGGVQVGNADLVLRDCVVTGNRASEDGGGVSSFPGTGNVTLVRTTVSRNVAGGNTGGGLSVVNSLLTVRESTVRRNISSGGGGGIFAGTATLTNSNVSGNSAGATGGGLEADTAILTNSTVSGNTAVANGGGINTGGTVTLTNSTVSGNTAGATGGGINAFGGTVTLTNSTVSGNSAAGAGGGTLADTATLTKSTFSGNSSGSFAGGIYAFTATLTNSTVSGNTADGNGGGILAGTATLTNSTFSGNSTGSNGGGIYAITATLLNCTVVENIAHTGGGLFHESGGTFRVRNTIVALNLVDFTGTGPDVSGAFVSQGHNLIGDGTGNLSFGVNGDIVGTSANPINPKLGPLVNNGGRTKTHTLKAGSLAIDHGENAGVPATDQRGVGFPRLKDGNGDGVAIVDIGAFER